VAPPRHGADRWYGTLTPVRRHLLVTNDFPPKVGGIQSYLWELWRRLPPEDTFVYTAPYAGSAAFDAAADFAIERSPEPVLLPYPWLVDRIRRHADAVGADLVLLDPAVPLGLIGPALGRPYGVVLHGAEVTIPGRVPGTSALLRRVLRGASLVVSAGGYPLAEGERCAGRTLPSVLVPPGVDTNRFRPLDDAARAEARDRFGIGPDQVAIATVNRLVPRKGMDVLVRAAARLAPGRPELQVLIGGTGRESDRLAGLVERTGAPVRLLGRLADDDVPLLYGAADIMAMLCHDRWAGLEQEGFGIVFLEAAAAGLAQVAGRSGGAAEAVAHGVSGLVVDQPRDLAAVAGTLRRLIDDGALRDRLGRQARERAVAEFGYDHLADRLAAAIEAVELRSPQPGARRWGPVHRRTRPVGARESPFPATASVSGCGSPRSCSPSQPGPPCCSPGRCASSPPSTTWPCSRSARCCSSPPSSSLSVAAAPKTSRSAAPSSSRARHRARCGDSSWRWSPPSA
jgi:phosphatidyl-myo-inositol dimannoside synthase